MSKRVADSQPQLKTGKTWYIQWYFTGSDGKRRRFRKSATEDGLELNSITNLDVRLIEANKMLEAIRAKVSPLPMQPGDEFFITALELAVSLKRSDKVKTMKTFRETARWFSEYLVKSGLQTLRCKQLTLSTVQGYFDYNIVKLKVSNTTHNTRKNNLRSLFTELEKRGYIDENFCKKIQNRVEGDPQRRPFSKQEFEKYMQYVARHDRGLYLCSLLLGYLAIRPGEERDLRCGAFDFATGVVRFAGKDSKNRRNSTITIPSDLIEVLKSFNLHEYPETYYVFGKAKGRHNKELFPRPDRIGENTLSERFRVTIRRMQTEGLLQSTKGLQLYSLKDTLALFLLDSGVDVVSAMHHFRQNSLEVFQRYVKRLGVVNPIIKDLNISLPMNHLKKDDGD